MRHGVGKPPPVKTAIVKWVNAEKRYGFLLPDDHSGDLFVHGKSCRNGDPVQGERVSYILGCSLSGKPAAVDVRRI